MHKKKRIINPNMVPYPVILPDARDKVETVNEDIKNNGGNKRK